MNKIILDQNKKVAQSLSVASAVTAAIKVDPKDAKSGKWKDLKAEDKDEILMKVAEKMGLWKAGKA
jgi:hypothetical protein